MIITHLLDVGMCQSFWGILRDNADFLVRENLSNGGCAAQVIWFLTNMTSLFYLFCRIQNNILTHFVSLLLSFFFSFAFFRSCFFLFLSFLLTFLNTIISKLVFDRPVHRSASQFITNLFYGVFRSYPIPTCPRV